jgi:hypothetical protein
MCRDHKWCGMYFDLQKRMLQPSFSLMRLMPLQQLDSMLRLGLIGRCNIYWWSFWTRCTPTYIHIAHVYVQIKLARCQIPPIELCPAPDSAAWWRISLFCCKVFVFFHLFSFAVIQVQKSITSTQCGKVCQWLVLILSGKRSEFQTWHPATEHWVEEHVKLHVLFAEHWKPCCMVSCRTLQGEKGVHEDKRNMCQTELNRGSLASHIKLFVNSLGEWFEVHNFLSSDFLDLNGSEVWSQGFWQGTVMT